MQLNNCLNPNEGSLGPEHFVGYKLQSDLTDLHFTTLGSKGIVLTAWNSTAIETTERNFRNKNSDHCAKCFAIIIPFNSYVK